MKVTVDYDLCDAHGDCVVAAPSVFDIGEDDDIVRVLDDDPGEDVRARVEEAARLCPVMAIRIGS